MNKNDGDFAAWAIGDKLGRDVNDAWDAMRNERNAAEQKRQAQAREDELRAEAETQKSLARRSTANAKRRANALEAQLSQSYAEMEALKEEYEGQLSDWIIAQFAQAKIRKIYQEQLGISTEQYREEYKKIKQDVLAEHPDIAKQYKEYQKLQSRQILKKYKDDTYTKEKSLKMAKEYDLLDTLEPKINEIELDKKAQVILDDYFANKMDEQIALERARERYLSRDLSDSLGSNL